MLGGMKRRTKFRAGTFPLVEKGGAKAQYPKCGRYAVVIVTYSVGLVGKIGLLCSLWMLAY